MKITINELRKLPASKIQNKMIPPKKQLPASPINIFDGAQLNIKKAVKDPIKIEKSNPNIIDETIIIIREQLPTRPSIPSIKLTKFIIPVVNIKDGIKNKIFNSIGIEDNSVKDKNKITVIT